MITVDTMRFADRYAGLPLCWILTAVRALSRPFARKRLPRPRKILVIKLSEMGSTVLAWPAFAEIKQHWPDSEILFLTLGFNRAIFDEMMPMGTLLTVDTGSPATLVRSGLDVLRRLWRERIDTTIDMDFFSRFSAALAYLVCRGNRVGFHRFTSEGLGRGRLLTHPVMYSTQIHTAAAFLSLVRALAQPDENGLNARVAIDPALLRCPEYRVPESARAAIRQRLEADGAAGRVILINPNSSALFPLRKWPLSSYAELGARLLGDFPDARLIITGVASEQSDADLILDRVRNPRCISYAGKTTFSELMALYAEADVMITNDSGPAHFAALVELPSVVLFGPETPVLYSPLNPSARCLYSHYACSPCVSVYNSKKSPCTRSLCLEAITVDEVLQNVRELMGARAARRAGCKLVS